MLLKFHFLHTIDSDCNNWEATKQYTHSKKISKIEKNMCFNDILTAFGRSSDRWSFEVGFFRSSSSDEYQP